MKKVFLLALACLSLVVVSCDQKEKIDWDAVTVNGFYVAGPATGSTEIKPECVMAAGFNEVDKAVREGMYEKYIVLEANKDFYLLYNDGGNKSRYSAELKDFETPLEEAYGDNPASVLKGALVIGEKAPAMQVAKTGLYHIVLDINKTGDLDAAGGAQILLLDASDFGVRGGMNGWGFSSATTKTEFSNDGFTLTFKDQELAKGGEFKFATGNYWKVTLDDAGKVKAETSLGETGSGLGLENAPGRTDNNIPVDKGGKYDITLNFKLAQGSFNKSFTYEVVCTEESTAPETMYMIGNQWGGWDWASDGIVDLIPVWGAPGYFWCTRYFNKADGFKFCAQKAWNGDFTGAGTSGYTINDGNCWVAEDGFYTVLVNGNENTVEVKPAMVCGLGDAVFTGGWDFDSAQQFEADGDKMVIVTSGAGELRLASKVLPDTAVEGVTGSGWFDWWKTEFIFFEDGKIAYRGAGNDQERVQIEAGKKIILDFNAGTATVEDATAFEPAVTIDGDFSDWADIEGATGESVSAALKVTSDEKFIYFYYERNSTRMADLWNGNGYVYLCFDLDNNESTGVELWGNGPYEILCVIYPYADNAIAIAAEGSAAPEGCTVANAKVAGAIADGVAFECSIPRADLLAMPEGPVNVWAWSNKGGTKINVSCTF